MSLSPKAIIIGAGVAGLASAIRLALQGMEVTVFEKNSVPGGKLQAFEKDGYRFDMGPSLFTQPANIEDLFTLAGENMEDYFNYRKVPVSCHYFYEDGTMIRAHADRDLFREELTGKTIDGGRVLDSYLDSSKKIYDSIGTVFVDHSLHKKKNFFTKRVLKALFAARWKYMFRSLHSVNATHFRDARTVQLFDRYATYNGSNPYRAPGMLSLVPHLEHNEGVYYPAGGMISITHALYRLALKKGVQFYFDSPVQRIICNGKKIEGVVVNGKNLSADYVVSNMDVYFTYKYLLADERRAKKLLKQERSSSALIFYWGIGREFTELDLHNIFFAKNYSEEFDHLFRLKKAYDDPTVYINITSVCEPGVQAPAGKQNWFVMVNAPANSGQDWEAFRARYRAAILAKLNRILGTDIGPLIETEEVLDPVSIESRTSSFMGSLYGSSSNSRMAAFLRHPNFANAMRGLYFVGGTVHPGGGIPLCLKSAKITSEIIRQDAKKTRQR